MKATGISNAAHLRREFDILLAAVSGQGAASLIHALAVEAVNADDGTLCDRGGRAGYAWQPSVYLKKTPTDPVGARVAAAGATLGRILAGGHPNHRSYLAYLEAVYVVTTTQSDDVAERIARLWDAQAQLAEDALAEDDGPARPSWYRRLWHRFLGWWRASYDAHDEEVV